MIHTRRTNAKAFSKNIFIGQEPSRRDWRWLDTVVVSEVNDDDW